MIVNIIPNYQYPNLLRQTPGSKGFWDGHEFVLHSKDFCDVAIVFNEPTEDLSLSSRKGGIWLFHQEVAFEGSGNMMKFPNFFDKVFTQSLNSNSFSNVINTQTALPWFVDLTYDELIDSNVNNIKKKDEISWITSNRTERKGHKKRLEFKEYLMKNKSNVKLYGRGFRELNDKFDGLRDFKYSLAVENTIVPHYWTEKIVDAYLSWCMPIYYGAPNILDYFPVESMILIDIEKPNEAMEIIDAAIADKKWEKNLDALEYCRNKILNEYQLFPWVSKMLDDANLSENKKKHFIPFDGSKFKGEMRSLKSTIKGLVNG